jgi:subtilase family serine protease
MRKLVILAATLALLGSTVMLVAQAPDLSHMYSHPPIQISSGPQNPNNPTGILPTEFRDAYGFNRISNLGAGQTIALVDAYDDPNIASDLAFYANYFHKTPCNFTKVIVGNPLQGQGWDLEESLDTQQACALAPQANIILVEANSNSNSDLFAAVQVAYSAPYNATVVSMSWIGSEFSTETEQDSIFCNVTNGNGEPVTFFASSGDGGHGVGYPSASHCVIAVGGTSLELASALPGPDPFQITWSAEYAWRDSGGGISEFEPEPSWQDTACAQFSPDGFRCVPDIASDANPGTGVPVYDTYSEDGWVEVGGTSVSSPDWASFITLVNSQRAENSQPLLSQAALDLYNAYYSSNYDNLFHDITSGSNGSCGLDCNAGIGYDLVTGIGSYQANTLFPALVADPN